MIDKKFYFKNYLFYVSITLVCILLISLIIVFDSVFARSIGATITEIKVENPSEIMEAYGKTHYLSLSFAHFYYINELGLIRTAVHENDINTYNLLNSRYLYKNQSTLQSNEIIYLQLTGNLQIKRSECPFCAGTLTDILMSRRPYPVVHFHVNMYFEDQKALLSPNK